MNGCPTADGSGRRVHYRVFGAGDPALIFIHGWGGSSEFWRANAPAFAPRHRVLVLDLPGHGQSDVPVEDATLGQFAAAVTAVQHEAGIGRAVLIGHSLGTAVACRCLRDHPATVAALVAVDGALFAYPVTPAQRETLLNRFRGADYQAEVAKFIRALFRQRHDPALLAEVTAAVLRTPQRVLVSAFADLLRAPAWELPSIPVPLLSLCAPSPLWNEAYLARARALAPLLEHRALPGAGHFLMLEQPAEFNAALADFLQRLPPPA